MNAQNFSAFLAQNALKETTKKIIVSDRFKDADGNPAWNGNLNLYQQVRIPQ